MALQADQGLVALQAEVVVQAVRLVALQAEVVVQEVRMVALQAEVVVQAVRMVALQAELLVALRHRRGKKAASKPKVAHASVGQVPRTCSP